MDNDSISENIATDISTFHNLLAPLEKNFCELSNSLKEIKAFFDDRLTSQQRLINNLTTRVELLEQRLSYNQHITALHAREIDDLEQVSRMVNVKICGIEVSHQDSPIIIMEKITSEVDKLGIGLNTADFDRCHRVGKKFKRNGSTHQDVMLKLCSWRARDLLFRNRKKLPFFVKADLTTRRGKILESAKEELEKSQGNLDDGENAGAISRTVQYIFIDENCKLKLKSTSGKYFMFNSMDEFFSIVLRLYFEDNATIEHVADGENNYV